MWPSLVLLKLFFLFPGFHQAQLTATNNSRMAAIPAGGSLVATTDYYRSESLLLIRTKLTPLSCLVTHYNSAVGYSVYSH